MNEHNVFPAGTEVEEALDFYFQTCSIEVNAKKLATMAATLANGGINPTTGSRVLSAETVKNCLVLLCSCGMYDYSGAWMFDVGLPSKSGVSGCIFVGKETAPRDCLSVFC
jgi:glutaminase